MDLTTLSDAELLTRKIAANHTETAIPIQAEMDRRRDERLAKLITDLTREVGLLSFSSRKVEGLTRWLIGLTWALTGLTVLAVGVAVVAILK